MFVLLFFCISLLQSENLGMQIGCVEEGEYICMAYEKNRWVSRRHEASAEEVR